MCIVRYVASVLALFLCIGSPSKGNAGQPYHLQRCGNNLQYWCITYGVEYCQRPLPPGYIGNPDIPSAGLKISGAALATGATCAFSQFPPTIVYCQVGEDHNGPYDCVSGLGACNLNASSVVSGLVTVEQNYLTADPSFDLNDPSIKDFKTCVTFANSQPQNYRYFGIYLEPN
jgi:hypothetical protein